MDTEWLTDLGQRLLAARCPADRPEDRSREHYNIFRVLGIEDKEVLICRFLGDLLDPKGTHRCGPLFLARFFRLLGTEAPADAELENAEVVLEEHTDKDRRIDIVIHLSNKVYPIEAKIWAGDQDAQLYDYWAYCQRVNAENIYYLTPNGRMPTKKSIRDLEDIVRPLSFRDDIRSWLDACAEVLNDRPKVQTVVKQFVEVIDRMCGSTKCWEEIKQAVFTDADPDKLRAAFGILENADQIRRQFQADFIRAHVKLPDGWAYEDIEPDGDEDKNGYKDAVLKVRSGKTKKILGYICVTTNLYVYAAEGATCKDKRKWQDSGTARPWRYLTFGSGGDKIDLRHPTSDKNTVDVFTIGDETIELDNYLGE